jgi:hypothetical protein
VGDIGIAQLPQQVAGQRRAAAESAVQDGAGRGVELAAVVGAGRVGVELEHAARGFDRARDGALLGELAGLAQVNQHGVPVPRSPPRLAARPRRCRATSVPLATGGLSFARAAAWTSSSSAAAIAWTWATVAKRISAARSTPAPLTVQGLRSR